MVFVLPVAACLTGARRGDGPLPPSRRESPYWRRPWLPHQTKPRRSQNLSPNCNWGHDPLPAGSDGDRQPLLRTTASGRRTLSGSTYRSLRSVRRRLEPGAAAFE